MATLTRSAVGVFSGMPISPGVATGRARIVTCPDAVVVGPGDILVVHTLPPSWTALMRTAGGVIAETASVLSDPAIVAREWGVPMVAGIRHATELIADGQWVTIDGAGGTISLH